MPRRDSAESTDAIWWISATTSWAENARVEQEADTVYNIVDVVGVSEKSWEDAGRNAVETAVMDGIENQAWTKADRFFLADALARGMSVAEVAAFLGRTEEEVRGQREALRLPRGPLAQDR